MKGAQLVESAKRGDRESLAGLLDAGGDVDETDADGWSALSWAAGRGDGAMIELLVERGADVFKAGVCQRTPYEIALAASHGEAARMLAAAEDQIKGLRASREIEMYCRAYALGELRRYPAWHEEVVASRGASDNAGERLMDDSTVFVHQDYTVTLSVYPDDQVIFTAVDPRWVEFCKRELDFRVPDEIELAEAV